jgi:hypothetical protein
MAVEAVVLDDGPGRVLALRVFPDMEPGRTAGDGDDRDRPQDYGAIGFDGSLPRKPDSVLNFAKALKVT